MKYKQKSFTVPVSTKVDVACPACVFSERWEKQHAPGCLKGIAKDVERMPSYPQLAPGQSFEEFCDLYQRCNP